MKKNIEVSRLATHTKVFPLLVPDLAHQFYKKIGEADALLISFAEHNGSYTAVFKNLYDWTSRIDMKVYQDKPVVMLSTSIGAWRG